MSEVIVREFFNRKERAEALKEIKRMASESDSLLRSRNKTRRRARLNINIMELCTKYNFSINAFVT